MKSGGLFQGVFVWTDTGNPTKPVIITNNATEI
jgi:hypothetical protein